MKRLTFFIMLLIQYPTFAKQNVLQYKDSSAPIEERVKDLVSRMNKEEKILQINQLVLGKNNNVNNIGKVVSNIPSGIGSLIYFDNNAVLRNEIQKKAIEESRLGIPVLFGFDVIHGFRTIYPIPLAQACSWNLNLVKQASSVAAQESKASGVDWTFSPMIDVARDGRWGRVAEGYGEDPYANAVFGVAAVKGYQGENLNDKNSIASCLKHYVGYGESEGGRDYSYTDISSQSLWETYLFPYEACVKAGASTLMSAFNDISGTPATANHYTLTEILKQKWKHDGFVVSDWNGVGQLVAQGVAKDRKDAAQLALMAGLDMDMKDTCYLEFMQQLIAENKVPMERIDDAVSRILRIKFRLGLFENPYTDIVSEKDRFLQAQSVEVARKLAEESMVLLKNNSNTLPISSGIKKIAMIGPIAKDKDNITGSWKGHGESKDVESLFEGVEKEWKGKAQVSYAKGCDFEGNDESYFKQAIELARNSDVIILCLGEKSKWGGENASRSTLSLPDIQEKLVAELRKVGKPIVLVLSNGRPIELCRIEPQVDAIVEIWQPGIAGGTPLAGILSGRINPSGKLAITFPLTTGQIPIYYNMRQRARPDEGKYQNCSTEPLYWFGHGLSYTTFKYGELQLSTKKIKLNEKLTVEVELSNVGTVKGTETVLWYISGPVCKVSRPIKELKFFEKKELEPGSKSIYKFEIDPMRDLSYVDANGNRFLEPGDYYVIVNDQKVVFEIVN